MGPRDLHPDCLAGDGEMAALMRSIDWSATPIGPVAAWSLALRTMVRLLLVNRFQLFLWWGPRYVQFYNDASRSILGGKHPGSMGQPAAECWSEIWHVIGPLIDSPFHGGPATWQEDISLEINRYGTPEETHFTIAYSPVPDDGVPSGIGGVFGTVHEITGKVVGERRVVVLRDLGSLAAEEKTAEEACVVAARTLAAHDKDIPFSMIYLIEADGRSVRLAASSGVDEGDAICPRVVGLYGDGDAGWPLAEVLGFGATRAVPDLSDRFGTVPQGPWSDRPTSAVVLPIPSTKPHQPAGLLVAGVSARLKLDEQYGAFLELVAGQIGTAIANARAYEEEKRRAEALAELDRAKTTFFSNVSHEFRTPLTLMLGPVEDALADPAVPLPAAQRERLQTAHRSSLRLLKLVNTLLDFSRIEAGRVQASYEPTDLATLTAELASNFRSACEKAGLRLEVDCPTLPEPVFVDRDMWEKVVLNLLSNAFKFTLAGEIEVRLRPAGDAAELVVRDTGTGIPASELPRVFERFHRVEASRGRTHEGTGIGLALVQELVKLHGGSVRAESAVGSGSTFTVAVPLGSAHLPADRILAPRSPGSTAIAADAFVEEAMRWLPDEETSRAFPGAVGNVREAFPEGIAAPRPGHSQGSGVGVDRPRVLWADDNADMRHYVRRLLGDRYDVEAVPDGEAALEAARARPPDLVLSDVMMPRLDGFGLLRALRADPRTCTIPVVLLSARAGEESRVEGLEAGADDYLVKPFSARELLARVGAHVALARARREASRREQELRTETDRVRERLEAVLSGLSDQFITLDRQWRYVFVNDRVCEVTGFSREEILGKDVWELFPEVIGTILEAELRRAAAEGVANRFEYYHEPFGRWFEIRIYPCTEGLSLFVSDITERKRAENALRVANERLDLAIRGSNLGIWDLELAPGGEYRHGPVRFINVWEPLGYDPAELPADAMASRAFGHPDDLVEVDRAVMACLAGETEEIRVENRIRHKDGSYHSLLTLGKAMRDETGRPVRLIGTVMDITDRKRLEVEMRLAKEAAEAANRSKDEFLANVSHEIRTPFGAILGMTELVLETPLTDDQRQCLETARSAAEGLLDLIDDLLDFEKIEAGKLELDPADFSLRDTLGAIVRTLVVQAQARALGLACDVPPDVPDALVGDAGRLRQVLLNLIGNAIKFTRQGGVVVRVEVADDPAPEGSSALRFLVIDTGIGIPPDGQERIFLAFEQVDSSSTRRYGGTGLGLTIAAGLVGLMGGAIGVDSEPGRGSTFSFTVRFGRQPGPRERAAVRPGDASHETTTPSPVATTLRILVAEDSEFNSRHLERLLARRGHAVRVAINGREALEQAVTATYDLLLLDLHMPELDGFQVVRAIRQREQATGGHLPVIALTARARKEDRERCLAAGMDGYLSKPARAADLFAAIDRVVALGLPRPGRPEPGGGTSLLDPAVLLAACSGEEEGLRALCSDFRAYAPARLAEVGDALLAGDAPRLREAAHTLCGLLSAFSTAGGDVAANLEDHAARGQLEEASPLVVRLEALVQELTREVDNLSCEGLRSQAGIADDPGQTAGS